MKKRIRILMPMLVTLAMVLSMFGTAIPALASEIQLAKNTDPLTQKYYLGDTIHYVLEVGNPVGNAATNYLDVVEDFLPDGSTVTLATGVTQAPGESNTYYLDYVVDEADLVYSAGRWRVVNELHVEGTDSLEDIIDATTGKSSIILRPEISIDKTVDCDGDEEFADSETTVGPDTPTWRIVVCNTGFDPVSSIHVTDTNGQDYTIPELAPGACDTHEYTGAEIDATITNTATAQGEDEIGGTVGPISDSATNYIIHPDICIEKLVDCNDDEEYLHEDTGSYGDTPSWYIRVWNCGDSPLIDVMVSDTNGMSWAPFDLAIGEEWEVTYDGDPIFATTTNEATASATDVFGGAVGPVYDEATNVVEIEPLICIEKLVDCNDDQEYLHEDTGSYGDTPSWYIRVWNCGDSPLLDVMVSDTKGMSWSPLDLAIGDEWVVTYDGDPIFEDTTNEATASATDVFGGAVGPVYDSATNVVVGNEGCTPGYWKNNAINWGASAWVGYAPGDSFETVFGVDVTLRAGGRRTVDAPTLLQALSATGGGINALARHAVAALLNIANPDIGYGIGSTAALITMVHDAIVSGDEAQIEALHVLLAGYNEAGCPINQHGDPIIPDDGQADGGFVTTFQSNSYVPPLSTGDLGRPRRHR